MKYSLRDWAEYLGYRFIEATAIYLPERLLPFYARGLAFLVFRVLKIRRTVALQNLTLAFPEMSPAKCLEIAYQSYVHFLLLILEFWKLWRWNPERLTEMVQFRSHDLVNGLLKENSGAILVSAHFGNWEIGGAYLTRYWKPFYVIQKRQKNRLVDQRMAALRRRWGMEIIYTRGAVRNSFRVLRKGHALALLSDQDAGKKGIFVPFFGRQASTPAGAAILHLKTGAPLFFGALVRRKPFHYQFELIPVPYQGAKIVNEENVQRVTAQITEIVEKYVRQFPEQYFWVHKRWKSSRPLETIPVTELSSD